MNVLSVEVNVVLSITNRYRVYEPRVNDKYVNSHYDSALICLRPSVINYRVNRWQRD